MVQGRDHGGLIESDSSRGDGVLCRIYLGDNIQMIGWEC